MAGEGGGISAGTVYIEVVPRLDQAALRQVLSEASGIARSSGAGGSAGGGGAPVSPGAQVAQVSMSGAFRGPANAPSVSPGATVAVQGAGGRTAAGAGQATVGAGAAGGIVVPPAVSPAVQPAGGGGGRPTARGGSSAWNTNFMSNGMMMTAMFGGWEVHQANAAANRANMTAGANAFDMSAQFTAYRSAVDQATSGPLGSIVGMFHQNQISTMDAMSLAGRRGDARAELMGERLWNLRKSAQAAKAAEAEGIDRKLETLKLKEMGEEDVAKAKLDVDLAAERSERSAAAEAAKQKSLAIFNRPSTLEDMEFIRRHGGSKNAANASQKFYDDIINDTNAARGIRANYDEMSENRRRVFNVLGREAVFEDVETKRRSTFAAENDLASAQMRAKGRGGSAAALDIFSSAMEEFKILQFDKKEKQAGLVLQTGFANLQAMKQELLDSRIGSGRQIGAGMDFSGTASRPKGESLKEALKYVEELLGQIRTSLSGIGIQP